MLEYFRFFLSFSNLPDVQCVPSVWLQEPKVSNPVAHGMLQMAQDIFVAVLYANDKGRLTINSHPVGHLAKYQSMEVHDIRLRFDLQFERFQHSYSLFFIYWPFFFVKDGSIGWGRTMTKLKKKLVRI